MRGACAQGLFQSIPAPTASTATTVNRISQRRSVHAPELRAGGEDPKGVGGWVTRVSVLKLLADHPACGRVGVACACGSDAAAVLRKALLRRSDKTAEVHAKSLLSGAPQHRWAPGIDSVVNGCVELNAT